MNQDWIILAIHSKAKAEILAQMLEKNGISTSLEPVHRFEPKDYRDQIYVKVPIQDLDEALALVENHPLDGKKNDDGRRRLLVAIDFSEDSIKACQVAFNIAEKIDAKVKLLHVYNNVYFPSHFPFADLVKDGPLDVTRRRMLQFCVGIDNKISKKEWPSINYSYSLREGEVREEIKNFVKEYLPNIVVMGTQGEHKIENGLIGSVTADVLEALTVPVLAVPRNSPINSLDDIKHIVYMVSLREWGGSSFKDLVHFASYNKENKITLLHIASKDENATKNKDILNQISVDLKRQYPDLSIETKLLIGEDLLGVMNEFTKDDDISIVCINTRKRNLLGRIFLPSVSRKLLASSNKAILVLRG